MQTNETPHYDAGVNRTGCCPKFNPGGWDDQELHFRDKPFVRATTRSVMHVPVNMGAVFARVNQHIDAAGASADGQFIVLSRDLSPWTSEHLFSVSKAVPEEEMTTLSGDFLTKVFEGPYSQASQWHEEMRQIARERKSEPGDVYFFYTTCPKCAKAYGKNYIVGVAAIA
ncbi:hypothetical protein RFN28_28780 [Mesorhizobium sp. VK24D]|uniref:Uncharacterized protein n=1 Tax=Mesorhizobium album TaxID=3072314 RepID=A0ABU4Y659_9HYPH|nr:hydrolase [Mesorhizobium sp. VK24D]MDX8482425.1 hypothetical protein [Mesorhizobium sp. VK24D]